MVNAACRAHQPSALYTFYFILHTQRAALTGRRPFILYTLYAACRAHRPSALYTLYFIRTAPTNLPLTCAHLFARTEEEETDAFILYTLAGIFGFRVNF